MKTLILGAILALTALSGAVAITNPAAAGPRVNTSPVGDHQGH